MKTFFGALLLGLLYGFLAWGCLAIILAAYHIPLPLFHPLLHMVIWMVGPPLLLTVSFIAWLRLRRMRRLEAMGFQNSSSAAMHLARGAHSVRGPTDNAASLSPWPVLGIILSTLAIPYWLHLPSPFYWASGILLVLWLLKR